MEGMCASVQTGAEAVLVTVGEGIEVACAQVVWLVLAICTGIVKAYTILANCFGCFCEFWTWFFVLTGAKFVSCLPPPGLRERIRERLGRIPRRLWTLLGFPLVGVLIGMITVTVSLLHTNFRYYGGNGKRKDADFIEILFYATAVATGTGYGDIVPTSVWTWLIISGYMILSAICILVPFLAIDFMLEWIEHRCCPWCRYVWPIVAVSLGVGLAGLFEHKNWAEGIFVSTSSAVTMGYDIDGFTRAITRIIAIPYVPFTIAVTKRAVEMPVMMLRGWMNNARVPHGEQQRVAGV